MKLIYCNSMSLSMSYLVPIPSKRIADGTGAALLAGCFGLPTSVWNDTGFILYIALAFVAVNCPVWIFGH